MAVRSASERMGMGGLLGKGQRARRQEGRSGLGDGKSVKGSVVAMMAAERACALPCALCDRATSSGSLIVRAMRTKAGALASSD